MSNELAQLAAEQDEKRRNSAKEYIQKHSEIFNKPKSEVRGFFDKLMFIPFKKNKEQLLITLDSGISFTGYVVDTSDSNYIILWDHLEENEVTDILVAPLNHISSIRFTAPVDDGKPKLPIGFRQE